MPTTKLSWAAFLTWQHPIDNIARESPGNCFLFFVFCFWLLLNVKTNGMKNYLFLFPFIFLLLAGCGPREILHPQDYAAFLDPAHIQQAEEKHREEIRVWQERLSRDTGSYVNLLELGYAYTALFHLKGDAAALRTGDSLIKRASAKLNDSDPAISQALTQVSITQHRFRDAEQYLQRASANGSPYTQALLSFDVQMELGNASTARNSMAALRDPNSFDYLIRKAKYEDHSGNLDGAIKLMEQAFERIKSTNRKSLYCWAASNLGDMYGHAGRIADSYRLYLDALEKDPSYVYALKGLAWIAYSYEGNTAEAKRLAHFISSQVNMPDIHLFLAEIAEAEGDEELKKEHTQQFLSTVNRPIYGGMYNKYLIELYTSDVPDLDKAEKLALEEVGSRPSPETWSWLSWVYHKKGAHRKAYDLYRDRVVGKTFEPDAQYKGALILLANGREEEGIKMLKECLESSFELGPVTAMKIREEIAGITDDR
jgi:tetratricopeptide (TPR) repeat protein